MKKLYIEKEHKTTYSAYVGDDTADLITLVNHCDGTRCPFRFSGVYIENGSRVNIETLKAMKLLINRALRDAENSNNNEFVPEEVKY